MNEFKFNCPTCGQHILANAEWVGRRINCPSCETDLTIPAPTKTAKKKTQPVPPAPAAPRKTAAAAAPAPLKAGKKTSTQLPAPPAAKPKPETPQAKIEAPKLQPTGATPPSPAPVRVPLDQPRVAVLTPAIKLDMVRAVRRRIKDKNAWLPGKKEGLNTYAAKLVEGQAEAADVKSTEATRHSLIGAFLLEFHLRQVTRTASGRTRLLDAEIPEAVQTVRQEHMSAAEREKDDARPAEERPALTHPQCLAVLDLLEAQFQEKMEQAQLEKSKRKLGPTRLPDLVKKLEQKAPVTAEEVATALYHELGEMRRRLDKLEQRADDSD